MQQAARFFELGRDRYQPDAVFTYSNDPSYTLDQRWLAVLVGLVALGLPVTMWVGTKLGVCEYHSISHFYYAQFLGGVFT